MLSPPINNGSARIRQAGVTSAFAELVTAMNRRPHRRRVPRRSRRRQYEGGVCRAARRAFTAGLMYLQNPGLTLKTAAELTGSNVAYATAAVVTLQSEDHALQEAVLAGKVPLLTAAKRVRSAAKLIAAYRGADQAAKLAFGTAVSPEVMWDQVMVPVLGPKPVSTTSTVENHFEAAFAA